MGDDVLLDGLNEWLRDHQDAWHACADAEIRTGMSHPAFRKVTLDGTDYYPIDRDALLALADKLEDKAASYRAQCPDAVKTWIVAANYEMAAKRIRDGIGGNGK